MKNARTGGCFDTSFSKSSGKTLENFARRTFRNQTICEQTASKLRLLWAPSLEELLWQKALLSGLKYRLRTILI